MNAGLEDGCPLIEAITLSKSIGVVSVSASFACHRPTLTSSFGDPLSVLIVTASLELASRTLTPFAPSPTESTTPTNALSPQSCVDSPSAYRSSSVPCGINDLWISITACDGG